MKKLEKEGRRSVYKKKEENKHVNKNKFTRINKHEHTQPTSTAQLTQQERNIVGDWRMAMAKSGSHLDVERKKIEHEHCLHFTK